MRLRPLVLPIAATVVALTVAGCGHHQTGSAHHPSTPPGSGSGTGSSQGGGGHSGPLAVGDKNTPMPAPNSCNVGSRDGQPTPDAKCTPGAINGEVNQNNINDTICKSGWTKTVRPPSSVTGKMKQASALSYHLGDQKGEYDHLISLELGGAPDDPRNLWVQPGPIPNPKDAVENKLNAAVCSGLVPLATAQEAIASSWVTAFDTAGLRVAGGQVCLRDNPSKCVNKKGDDTSDDS